MTKTCLFHSITLSVCISATVLGCAEAEDDFDPHAESTSESSESGTPHGGPDCDCIGCWTGCWGIRDRRVGMSIDEGVGEQLITEEWEADLQVEPHGVLRFQVAMEAEDCIAGQCRAVVLVDDGEYGGLETMSTEGVESLVRGASDNGHLVLRSRHSGEVLSLGYMDTLSFLEAGQR